MSVTVKIEGDALDNLKLEVSVKRVSESYSVSHTTVRDRCRNEQIKNAQELTCHSAEGQKRRHRSPLDVYKGDFLTPYSTGTVFWFHNHNSLKSLTFGYQPSH